MKTYTLSFSLILGASLFFNQALAQDGYTYTLVSDGYRGGTYNFRVQAVPLATSTSTTNPNIQSYGLSGTENFTSTVFGTDDIELTSNKFSVYPNASSDSFSVSGLTANATISLYSVSGKSVFSVEDYAGEAISILDLSSGLYLVSIESENSKEVKKIYGSMM